MTVGLDVGTSNLLVARITDDSEVEVKRLRNAFVEIDEEQQSRLASGSSLNAVMIKDKAYIVGDEAISIARVLNKDLRRPMASGVLNPDEKDARLIISTLVRTLIGDPQEEDERCAFSIPAIPLDNAKANNVWHTGFFTKLLRDLGYDPEPINEALAIIYSDCGGEDNSTGIAISHGAGQVNVAASYKGIASIEFSVARSGDWIDYNSASAVGISIAKVLKIKEDPEFDLRNSEALDEEVGPALYFHYKEMIKYEIKHLVQQWVKMKNQMDFPDAIPIILSGGTASLRGFKELWEEELHRFQKRNPLPFKVSEVRMARDPFGAVARGLLTYAIA